MKKAYYARPISLYGTPQEARDIDTLHRLGFEAIDIDKPKLQEQYEKTGMSVFESMVKEADALFFRPFIDGTIGAGVGKEIKWALEAGLPIAELPRSIHRRTLSVEATRDMLAELGQR